MLRKTFKATYFYPGLLFAETGKTVDFDHFPTYDDLVEKQKDSNWYSVSVRLVVEEEFVSSSGESRWLVDESIPATRAVNIYIGRYLTLDEVGKQEGTDSILYGNVNQSDFVGACHTRTGNWQPVSPRDKVFDTTGNVLYAS